MLRPPAGCSFTGKHGSQGGRSKMSDHLTGIGWNWDKLQSFGNISNELYPNFWKLSPWSYSTKPSYGFVNSGMPKKGKNGTVHWKILELTFPLICAGSLTIPGPSRSKRTDVSIGSGGALWMLRMDGFILESLRCTCD